MNDIIYKSLAYFFADYMRLRFTNSDLQLLLEACETETLQLQSELVVADDHKDTTIAVDEIRRRISRYQRARRMIEEALNEEV